MTARRSRRRTASRRKTARRSPRKAARKPARRKAAPRKAAASLAALARKFVQATLDPAKFDAAALYTQDCVSIEGTGEVHRGHAGIRAKLAQWEAMQTGTKWKPRNVFTGRNLICIEWDAEVTLRDGRVVKLPEVAIHEIAGGKIARERYYYNPLAFTPSA